MSEEPQVSYNVKELFEKLEKKIDQFLALLTTKADRADVNLLEDQHLALEQRVTVLETRLTRDEKMEDQKRDYRRFVIPALIGLVGAVATIASILIH